MHISTLGGDVSSRRNQQQHISSIIIVIIGCCDVRHVASYC